MNQIFLECLERWQWKTSSDCKNVVIRIELSHVSQFKTQESEEHGDHQRPQMTSQENGGNMQRRVSFPSRNSFILGIGTDVSTVKKI